MLVQRATAIRKLPSQNRKKLESTFLRIECSLFIHRIRSRLEGGKGEKSKHFNDLQRISLLTHFRFEHLLSLSILGELVATKVA